MDSLRHYPRGNPARWWKTRSIGHAHRAPQSTFIGSTRRWVGMATLLLLAGIIGGVVYMTSSRRLAGMAQILLSNALDGRVTVKSAHLSFSGVLQLSGVRLVTDIGRSKTELFSADTVRVDFNWLSLVSGKLSASHIRAVHPVLNLVEDLDTRRWNYENFLRHPHRSESTPSRPPASSSGSAAPHAPIHMIHLPSITLTGAVVRWGVIRKGVYSLAGESVIDGVLRPLHHSRVLYGVSIQQESVNGRPGLNLDGSWNIATRTFDAAIERLRLSSTLRRSLPPALQHLWRNLGLRGEIRHIHFRIGPHAPMDIAAQLAGVSLAIPYHSRRLGSTPIPIRQLTGKVLFSDHVLSIENLQGRALGWKFVVPQAHFNGLGHGDPFDVTVRLPDLNLPPRYPAIFRTSNFRIVDGIFYRLRPSGLLNVTVSVSRSLKGGDIHVAGIIHCLNLAARYVHFPYPLHDVHGIIRFTAHHIHFVHVRAVAETFPVSLNGLVSIDESGGPIDLQISSPRGYFDRRLAACLPRNIKPIWNKFTPEGYGAFEADVTRPAGENSSPRIVLHIFPQDVTGYYHDFPYVMHHVHGELIFSDRMTKIIKLTAPVGRHGSITFTGDVDYHSGHLSSMKPHVKLTAIHLPVNSAMLYSLPRSFEHALEPFHAHGGYVNVSAMITRGADNGPSVSGTLTLVGTTLTPKLLPWPLTDVAAQATIAPRHFIIQSITGRIAGSRASSVQAAVTVDEPTHQPVDVHAHALWSGLTIKPTAPAQIKATYRTLWNKYRPAGNLSGGFQLAMSIPRHGRTSLWSNIRHLSVQLSPHDMTLSPKAFPAPIRHLSGSVDVAKGKVQITSLTADAGPIAVSTSGVFIPVTGTLKLQATAKAPRVSHKWIALLPPAPRKLIEQLHPRGAFELYFTDLERRIEKSGPGWKFVGSLALHHFLLHHTLEAAIGSGIVTVAGDLDAHETVPNLAGEFHLKHVLVAGRTVRALKGELTGDRVNNTVTINHISGSVAGGVLSGHVLLHFKPQVSLAADFNLSDAQLAALLKNHPMPGTPTASTMPATQPTKPTTDLPRISSGVVNASLHFSQLLGKLSSSHGYGDLLITKANIYNVPLSMGLLQIATLRLPVSSAFNRAKLVYLIKGHIVNFSKIQLHSPGVDLLGRGSLNLTDQHVDLELITQSPSGTEIPVLGFIVGMARSQLLQLHVHGPISNPKITPIPLRILALPFGAP
jgi:hypothetical protein